MTTDKILFILSNDITDETILAVLAALQNYEKAAFDKIKGWNSVHKQDRQISLKIHLVYENERHYFIFDRCLPHLISIKKTIDEVNTKTFDCIVALSISAALKIADKTNKPLADALGVLIGGEGGTLPDVSNLCQSFVVDIGQLIDSKFLDTYTITSSDIEPHSLDCLAIAAYYFADTSMALEQRALSVFKSKCAIGYSSFETYLACALKKPVLEIQKNKHLYKWSNPNYFCVTDENKDNVIKGVELCLQKICDVLTVMDQETSSVQDVHIT